MKATPEFKVGDRVKYKAAGKVARLEGMSGKIVEGTVRGTLEDGFVSVMADYRINGVHFKGMGSSVPIGKLSHV